MVIPTLGVPPPWVSPRARGGWGTVASQSSAPPTACPCSPPVRQLIKSQRVQNKLGIVFEKEKDKTQRKDFVFVSARVGRALLGPGGKTGPL